VNEKKSEEKLRRRGESKIRSQAEEKKMTKDVSVVAVDSNIAKLNLKL